MAAIFKIKTTIKWKLVSGVSYILGRTRGWG
jgi:hypothetical protein